MREQKKYEIELVRKDGNTKLEKYNEYIGSTRVATYPSNRKAEEIVEDLVGLLKKLNEESMGVTLEFP